jgi:uncharacterized membrane protein YdjX (TVP38/TMEM64 family)
MPVQDEIRPIPSRRSTLVRGGLFAFILLLIACFYLLGGQRYFVFDYLRQDLDRFENLVHEHFFFALILFAVVYVVLVALSLPATAGMTILAGALFGRWIGTGVSSIAATVGATMAFLSSRYLFRAWIENKYGRRLHALQCGIEKDGGYYLFIMRVVAVVPYFLINAGMGLTRIRTWKFVWISWLGILPVAFLYANAGTEIQEIQSAKDVLSPSLICSLAALGIFPLVVRTTVRRIMRLRRKPHSPLAA